MYQKWRRLHRSGMQRLQVARGTLYERTENRRFTVLVEESVLRYRVGGSEVMLAQLGHLLSATELPAVRLGIIPFRAEGRPGCPLSAWRTTSGCGSLRAPQDISLRKRNGHGDRYLT